MAGGSSPRLPSSDEAARLTRTMRRSSSTATMPSLAPSRIAARSACSPARVSRSWAARKAIASSWRTSASSRIRSGGSEAPSGGRSAMSPTVRDPPPCLAELPALVQRHAVPAAPADPGVSVGRRREAIGDARAHPDPTTRRLRRAQPQVVRLRGCASQSAPATASLTRTSSPMTLAAITPSSPPSARSWLSWYCAKTVSAWRWASSKIRRRSAAVTADGCGCGSRSSAGGRAASPERAGSTRSRPGPGAARPLAQPEREAAARDQRPRGAHARVGGARGPPERRRRCRRRRVRRRRTRPPPGRSAS